MVNSRQSDSQAAPDELEPVRTLLNSWLVPNDSREPTDRFDDLVRQHGWARRDARLIRELRDDIRHIVEDGYPAAGPEPVAADERLNRWITRLRLRVTVAHGTVIYAHDGGPAGEFLTAIIDAVASKTWRRLKACPDCHWVFYDHTRNGSKRWCLMYAGGPDGRACGTIAKVRRYRAKQAATSAG